MYNHAGKHSTLTPTTNSFTVIGMKFFPPLTRIESISELKHEFEFSTTDFLLFYYSDTILVKTVRLSYIRFASSMVSFEFYA